MIRKNDTPVPKLMRKLVTKRADSKCEYIDAKYGRCRATTGLSIHHKKYRCNGGGNHSGNLILVCNYHKHLMHGLICTCEHYMNKHEDNIGRCKAKDCGCVAFVAAFYKHEEKHEVKRNSS